MLASPKGWLSLMGAHLFFFFFFPHHAALKSLLLLDKHPQRAVFVIFCCVCHCSHGPSRGRYLGGLLPTKSIYLYYVMTIMVALRCNVGITDVAMDGDEAKHLSFPGTWRLGLARVKIDGNWKHASFFFSGGFFFFFHSVWSP